MSCKRVMALSPRSGTKSLDSSHSGPFSGLVICVTGLSKEARKQVMAATDKLGGEYSANLHPQCTHLVVQSFCGRKFEHALKHGIRNGLSVVTLSWFIDSVRQNRRMSESHYNVRTVVQSGFLAGELSRLVSIGDTDKSCLPNIVYEGMISSSTISETQLLFPGKEHCKSGSSILAGQCIYIDPDISPELHQKIVEAGAKEGAIFIDKWFIGCSATHVVCEGNLLRRYIGCANHLVTPLWILKSTKEKCLQRLVHFSADLARQVTVILDNAHIDPPMQDAKGHGSIRNTPLSMEPLTEKKLPEHIGKRQKMIEQAKTGVRNRRGHRIQSAEAVIRPLTPSTLLDSICWSISEPSLTARIFMDTSASPLFETGTEDAVDHASLFFDAHGDGRESEASGDDNISRPLRESEKREVIFKGAFLTILFPVDRFGEMGPSARTFFCAGGFSRLRILDHIYAFYQENMSEDEIDVAIHTDSRHADRLRSIYASKESIEEGVVPFKRIDFLGSRRSFELLKRVSGETGNHVYELQIGA
ncbi:uncharacterized protein LOC18432547 isoform X1 [Amborella trichopoda]|uniref:uncharacterized protein LOC18432547 isoform X1 n=2 Tax=Amborella trichopoda TaxID=13333 RepID=UPI0009BC8BF1|nr:uncharacterized protein LOC18432547 isoform X1 [Amborella trichopoda]|eukprot:XP_011622762.2 uncharacterized protein LOC18432547 isoform X1 [Amborella trichopoda]